MREASKKRCGEGGINLIPSSQRVTPFGVIRLRDPEITHPATERPRDSEASFEAFALPVRGDGRDSMRRITSYPRMCSQDTHGYDASRRLSLMVSLPYGSATARYSHSVPVFDTPRFRYVSRSCTFRAVRRYLPATLPVSAFIGSSLVGTIVESYLSPTIRS